MLKSHLLQSLRMKEAIHLPKNLKRTKSMKPLLRRKKKKSLQNRLHRHHPPHLHHQSHVTRVALVPVLAVHPKSLLPLLHHLQNLLHHRTRTNIDPHQVNPHHQSHHLLIRTDTGHLVNRAVMTKTDIEAKTSHHLLGTKVVVAAVVVVKTRTINLTKTNLLNVTRS